MSRKRKKKPGSDRPADQQPEIIEQPAAVAEETRDQRSEKKSQKSDAKAAKKAPAKGQDLDAKPQIHPIEEKWRNMDDRTWFRAAAWITALAAFLRYFMLLLRPVHHDEGVNGWMLTNLLRDNVYKYDPSNYHGPTIYFIAYPLMKLFGLQTMPLRSLSSFFGLMMVVMVLYLRRYLGNVGTLIAAFLVAISPGMVFISRYFIHEIFFVFYQLCFVVAALYFIEKRKAGPMAIAWMWILLIVCFLPGALLGGKYLGGENETAVDGLRFVLFLVDVAIVWYIMKFLTAWDEGRPLYFLLAAASLALVGATKETGFISLGTMAIAIPCVWLWKKIGPRKTFRKTLQRNALIGTGIAAAAGVYYRATIVDGFSYLSTEFLHNAYRPQDPFMYYTLMVCMAITLLIWLLYVADLGKSNTSVFEEPAELRWKNFREGLGSNKHMAIVAAAAFVFFWYLWTLFFTSFFSYREGFWKSFEAYKIWSDTGTHEHSQNGTWAYLKWGSKGENAIILGSIIGSLIAIIKNKHRFAVFTAAWAIGVFAAYMIIPYKTPWCALNYVLPMCLVAGYGLNELILSNNRRLNLAAYAFLVAGSVLLGYGTVKMNWFRYDDDQQPYVYAHTRRGFVDMINQIDYYAQKSGKNFDAVIDVTSPDYWPMTWYVINYNHVGYHGHIVDTQAEMIVTKKKDQDTEALAKYAGSYKYIGEYPLRPGVDLNLLVRNDIADPPCTGAVQDGVQKGEGVVVYNTEHCSRDMSVIPSIPATP
jgi:predicted membrane-bound mannosyltransferase